MGEANATRAVEQYIEDNEPVDQDIVEAEFGRRGLRAVRELMEQNRVSYTLDWDLQTESRTDT